MSKPQRDFPIIGESFYGVTKAVCKKCHYAFADSEPASQRGEYWHPIRDQNNKEIVCPNAGKCFHMDSNEVEPFMKKSMRRRNKRNKVKA
jgi:hypothetical protein